MAAATASGGPLGSGVHSRTGSAPGRALNGPRAASPGTPAAGRAAAGGAEDTCRSRPVEASRAAWPSTSRLPMAPAPGLLSPGSPPPLGFVARRERHGETRSLIGDPWPAEAGLEESWPFKWPTRAVTPCAATCLSCGLLGTVTSTRKLFKEPDPLSLSLSAHSPETLTSPTSLLRFLPFGLCSQNRSHGHWSWAGRELSSFCNERAEDAS